MPNFRNRLRPEEKLAFYRDYLIRARDDAMEDKAALTNIVNFKIVVFGAAIATLYVPVGLLVIALLPLFLFALDFLHRMRFIEIFYRWEYINSTLIRQIRTIMGVTNFEFFESQTIRRRKDLELREQFFRTAIILLPLAFAPVAVVAGVYYLIELYNANRTVPLACTLALAYIGGIVWGVLLLIPITGGFGAWKEEPTWFADVIRSECNGVWIYKLSWVVGTLLVAFALISVDWYCCELIKQGVDFIYLKEPGVIGVKIVK